jgi:phosphorylcholine metabolism protein LicD
LISWDEDIDIGIWPQDDYEPLLKKINENFTKPECFPMDIKNVSTLYIIKTGDYHITSNSIDPYLDIIPFYEGNGSYWFLRGIKDGNVVGLRYPKIFFDSFEQIEFKGLTFNVPANTNEYLAYLYNDWRRSQKIEEYMLPNRVEAIVRLFEVYCEA